MRTRTHRLEFIQLRVWLVRRFIRTGLGQNLLEARKHGFFVKLIAVVLKPVNEFLHRPLGLEGE